MRRFDWLPMKVLLWITFGSPGTFGQLDEAHSEMISNYEGRVNGVVSNIVHSDEKRLLDAIMAGYDSAVRPVINSSTPVVINLGLTLIQIFEMDEKNQVLVSNVWLDQEWTDEFLRWSPQDYNGIRNMRLPGRLLWRPDLVLYNSASDYNEERILPRAMVSHDGVVFWPVPSKLKSSCMVAVTFFPFDEQTCRLKYGSWTYDGFQVDVVKRKTNIDMDNYVRNGEWDIAETSVLRNVTKYPCCPEPYPDVSFTMVIRRRTLYYVYQIIYPCVVMSSLSLLVFLLPPESGEKIGLGITVLLAFSVLMLSIAESLPETSESVPLISIYLCVVMSLSSISVITSVLVLRIHHRPSDAQPLPRCLRQWLRPKNIAFPLLTDSQFPRERSRGVAIRKSLETLLDNMQSTELDEFDFSGGLPYGLAECQSLFPNSTPHVESEARSPARAAHTNATPLVRVKHSAVTMSPAPALDCDVTAQCNCDQRKQASKFGSPFRSTTEQGCRCEPRASVRKQNARKDSCSSVADSSCSFTRRSFWTSMQILEALKVIVAKYDSENAHDVIVNEYQQLARIIDRLLFVVYGLATIISTLTILVFVPLSHSYGRNASEIAM